ncbi:MAG: hypothetical protein INQ03_02355 [Candidatus Heimdallarchaeota archaeon]|nr:hypothetical protein [Candidatus Heimdallarchaeota archaeon]
MRILIYSPGSGGGHFNRNLSIACDLVNKHQVTIIQSSPLFPLIKQLVYHSNLKIHFNRDPSKRKLLLDSLLKNQDILIIDSFLTGLEDELIDILNKDIPIIFVFRRSKQLIMDNYLKLISKTGISVIIPSTHDLAYIHDDFLYTGHLILTPEKWRKLGININPATISKSNTFTIFLIHLGGMYEIAYLKEIADSIQEDLNARIFECIPSRLTYPGFLVIMQADLIICGAGYNIMAEIIEYNKQAIVTPFVREFDDQFARALTYKALYPNNIFLTPEEYFKRPALQSVNKPLCFVDHGTVAAHISQVMS